MKHQLISSVLAVFFIAGACGSDGPDEEASQVTTSEAAAVEAEESSEAEETGTSEIALRVPEAFAANPAGTYSFEFGGGRLALSAASEFFFADLGNVVFLDDPENPGGGSNYYGFLRPINLPTDTGTADGTDPETWIAENSSLTVEQRDVSDPRWQIYRLSTETTIDLVEQVQLKPGELYELWFLTVDAPIPLVLMGKTLPATPEEFDVLRAVAESVEFELSGQTSVEPDADVACTDRPWECGEPGLAPAGIQLCAPALGGMGFELSAQQMVIQPNPWWLLIEAPGAWEGEQNPALVLIKPSQTVDGEPITSAQQVFELQDAAMEMTQIETRSFFGSEVSGYAFVGEALEPELFSVVTPAEQEQGVPLEAGFISPPPFGEVWYVDTAEGPVLVSAAAWVEEELPAAVAILDEVGPSLVLQPTTCP